MWKSSFCSRATMLREAQKPVNVTPQVFQALHNNIECWLPTKVATIFIIIRSSSVQGELKFVIKKRPTQTRHLLCISSDKSHWITHMLQLDLHSLIPPKTGGIWWPLINYRPRTSRVPRTEGRFWFRVGKLVVKLTHLKHQPMACCQGWIQGAFLYNFDMKKHEKPWTCQLLYCSWMLQFFISWNISIFWASISQFQTTHHFQ